MAYPFRTDPWEVSPACDGALADDVRGPATARRYTIPSGSVKALISRQLPLPAARDRELSEETPARQDVGLGDEQLAARDREPQRHRLAAAAARVGLGEPKGFVALVAHQPF